MQNKYIFPTFIVYEVNYHRDQVQSSGYLPWDHEISSILRGNRAQVLCWMGKKVSKWHPGKYEWVFPLCRRRAAFIGLHQSLWSFFQSSAVQISPIWTLPSPPYRLLSQPSHCEYPCRGMAPFLSWHHFPSPDTAFTYVAFQNCRWGWIWLRVAYIGGLPRWCSGKEFVCQCRRCKRWGFNPWVRKIPWSRKWQPNPVFLPGKFHGQRGLAGYSPWGSQKVGHDWACTHIHTHTHTHTKPYSTSLVREPFHRRKSHPLFPCCKFSPWKFWISKGIHLLKR